MNSVKNCIWFICILIIPLSLSSCSKSHKFEINQLADSVYFPKAKHKEWEYRDQEFHNNYHENVSSINSIYFPDSESTTWINIEHLVPLVPKDVELLPDIEHTDYLFSAIEFHKDISVKEIELEHYYQGKKLKLVGAFVYRYPRLSTGEIDRNKPFIVTRIETNKINIHEQFVFVQIYEMPNSKLLRNILPKEFWFSGDAAEKFSIKYEENNEIKSRSFEFKLYWKERVYWPT